MCESIHTVGHGTEQPMSTTLAGALATAGLLGVTHAVEPDHVAGIVSLTGRHGDARRSGVAGVCFSAGHVILVMAWLTVGYLLLGHTEFPAVFHHVGTVGAGLLLGALGGALVLSGIRRLAYTHSHAHGHDEHHHSHAHTHIPLSGEHGRVDGSVRDVDHGHNHTARTYLKTGVVGALFTLSPPLSMIVFSATLFSAGPELIVAAAVAYAVSITGTMGALGAGIGAFFRRAGELSVRVHAGVKMLTGVLVLGLAVSLLGGSIPIPV